jgi:serine/threonine protein kinase
MNIIRSISHGSLLHRGGEAALYKVESVSGKPYTLKLYNSGIAFDSDVIGTIAANAVAGAYRIAEYGDVDGNAYILYDYIDGVCSRELSPMPLAFALHSLRRVVATLAELQKKGISHGDISPDNIFFDRAGNPVLIDFGICGPGAPKYSAPERIDGQRPSEKADLFSLGALFFFWLTAEQLFDGNDLDEIREKLRSTDKVNPGEILYGKIGSGLAIKPEDLSLLEPLWKGLLAANPESRLENLEELDELLEIALDAQGGQGVRLAREIEKMGDTISGILGKSGTKTLEKAEFPFFEREKQKNTPLKKGILAAAVFIFLVIAAICVFLAGGKSPSIDDTGDALLQKSRSHEMGMPDSEKMPDLEGVLKKLSPEESE